MATTMVRSIACGVLLCCCALPALAQEQQPLQPIVATDLLKIHELGSVAVSPDGRYAAYTVKTIVPEPPDSAGAYTYRTQLYLVPTDGSAAARPLTRGDQSASQPAWHPDGDQLAFVRTIDGKAQLFVLPLIGGEPYQLTRFEHGVAAPSWSPDGSKLLFAASLPEAAVRAMENTGPLWPDERPGRTPGDARRARPDPDGTLPQVQAWLDRNSGDGAPRVFTRLNLQGELDLAPQPTYRHLFVVEAEEGARPVAVTRGFHSFGGGAWLPNSQQIVVSGAPVDEQHPDRAYDSDLFLASVDGGRLNLLLDLDGYTLTDPQPSPDGRTVAFLARDLNDRSYGQTEVGLFALAGRRALELVTLHFDRSLGDLAWSEEGWYLYFTAPSDGGFPLYRMPAFEGERALADEAQGGVPPPAAGVALSADSLAPSKARYSLQDVRLRAPSVEQLTGFERGVRSYDLSRATVVYVITQADNPYELYAANLEFTRERRLTAHNATWLAEKQLSRPEAFALRRDSVEIPYWIMKPAFFEPDRTYPLLLQIHGGPAAMWGPGEATMWHEFQFFAARGYGIVYANPRGSSGYGYAFERANYQDWGAGPAGDVLAVATEAARQPWVDPERQVITGGSYAGYLTAWIVAHDDRFKAAVAQRGVYDLATFLGEGNAWRLVPEHFGGYPWEDVPAEARPRNQPLLEARLAEVLAALDSLAALADSTLAEPALLSEAADSLAEAAVEAMPSAEAEGDAAEAGRLEAEAVFAATDTTLLAEEPTPAAADSAALAALDTTALAAADTTALEVVEVAAKPLMRDLLARNSPLTYVDQIRTPLLIIHGDNDLRTGITQSEVLYKSLKILDRPVEYVRYPKAGHDLSRTGDPKQRLDRLLRIYEFMARFVGDEAPAVQVPRPDKETEAAQQEEEASAAPEDLGGEAEKAREENPSP